MMPRFTLWAAIMLLAGVLGCGKPAEVPRATTDRAASPAPATAAMSGDNATSTTATPVAETPTALAPAATPAAAEAAANGEINVYMWSEYIDPELLVQFKNETGIKVNLSVYEATEEMLAKLQQGGGVAQYDVLVSADHSITLMQQLNLIQPLDKAQIPNIVHVDQRFATPPYDAQAKFSVPYQWGTMGVIIDKKQVPQYDESWGLFLDPAKQLGNFLLIDSMRDMLAAGLKYHGKSINTTDTAALQAAGELIQKAKASPKALGFEGGAGGKNKVADGTAAYAIVYNGDALRAVDEDKEGRLAFFVPKEGTLIWVDAMTIPAKAPNPAGAHKFINFILDAKNGATLSNFNKYATPNTASLPFITPDDRANPGIYPPEEQMAKMEFLQDVGAATTMYDQIWTAIKAK